MVSYSRYYTLVVIFLMIIGSSPVLGKALEDRNWIEVSTANFNVRSLLGEKETLALARQLEMFRVAVAAVTAVTPGGAAVPTEVYAVRRGREFEHFGVDQQSPGSFTAGLRNNTILIRDSDDIAQGSSVLHDYARFLIRNSVGPRLPKWYNEGLAAYLSVIRTRRDGIDVGLADNQRREHLRKASWIALDKIIAAEQHYDRWTAQSKAAFDAQAWALVHYLLSRSEPKIAISAAMARYLEFIDAGTNATEAFGKAFGVAPSQLNSELRRYVGVIDDDYLGFEAEALIPNFKASVVKLSSEHISIGLARVALERGKLDLAEHWFTHATKDKLTRPRAESGLGDVLKFRGDFAAAQPRFEQAVALAPNDLYVQLDLAEYWHYCAMHTKLAADRKIFLENARKHYVTAWKLNDSAPETYAMYGQTYLLQGKYDTGIEMLEEAGRLLPANDDIRLILAEAYAGAGREQQAIDTAHSIMLWSRDIAVAARAREILAQFD